eukprot:gene6765-7563_t
MARGATHDCYVFLKLDFGAGVNGILSSSSKTIINDKVVREEIECARNDADVTTPAPLYLRGHKLG